MLEKLETDGIPLPRIYVAQTMEDISVAKRNGLPYVIWRGDHKTLLAVVLLPTLKKLLPGVKWDKFLGIDDAKRNTLIDVRGGGGYTASFMSSRVSDRNRIVDSADSKREFDGGSEKELENTGEVDLKKLAVKMDGELNIEALQHLDLLPTFIGDIRDCVRANLTGGTGWRYGWNKKLGAAVGTCDMMPEPNNLIIIDVSASIPDGISSTMLALAETLREQCCADLIITSSQSRFYPRRSELPTPEKIRVDVGYGNERKQFLKILRDHVAGKHWRNVIAFGDYDWPGYLRHDEEREILTAQVDRVVSYHTRSTKEVAGYAKWCTKLEPKPEIIYAGSDWCEMLW